MTIIYNWQVKLNDESDVCHSSHLVNKGSWLKWWLNYRTWDNAGKYANPSLSISSQLRILLCLTFCFSLRILSCDFYYQLHKLLSFLMDICRQTTGTETFSLPFKEGALWLLTQAQPFFSSVWESSSWSLLLPLNPYLSCERWGNFHLGIVQIRQP